MWNQLFCLLTKDQSYRRINVAFMLHPLQTQTLSNCRHVNLLSLDDEFDVVFLAQLTETVVNTENSTWDSNF